MQMSACDWLSCNTVPQKVIISSNICVHWKHTYASQQITKNYRKNDEILRSFWKENWEILVRKLQNLDRVCKNLEKMRFGNCRISVGKNLANFEKILKKFKNR